MRTAGTICRFALGSLAGGGGGATVTFAVDVAQVVSAGVTAIVNTASVSDDGTNGPDLNPTNNSSTDTTPLPDETAAPDLVITKDELGTSAAPGGRIDYTLVVTNDGTQGATGVMVEETVPDHTTFDSAASTPGWDCPDGSAAGTICRYARGALADRETARSVAAGSSTTIIFAVNVVDIVPAGVSAITNTAAVMDDGRNGPDLNPRNNVATDMTPLPDETAAPDLVITKDEIGTSAAPGSRIDYVLEVVNDGTQGATGVVVEETVPEHTSFDASSSSEGWDCADGALAGVVCRFEVGSLAGGGGNASVTFAVVVAQVVPAGVDSIINTASVADDERNGPDLNPDNNTATDKTPLPDETAAPDLVITKDDAGLTTVPGDRVDYLLTVTNDGTQGATGVTITEEVPAEATFDATASTLGWDCADGAAAGARCRLALGSLAGGGAETEVVFAVTVVDVVASGVTAITNTASVEDDGRNGADLNPANNTATDTTPLGDTRTAPDLRISKDDGGAVGEPGGIVVYMLNVDNVGTQFASGVVVREMVPENTTFDADASSPGWSCRDGAPAGTECELALGWLAVRGPIQELRFAVKIVDPLPPNVSRIRNRATVNDDGSNGPDLNPLNNSAGDSTPIDLSGVGPDLVVTKDDGGLAVIPGGTIQYDLSVQNVGTRDATGVVLRETVPEHTTFRAATSTRGWSCADGAIAGSICELQVGFVGAGGDLVTATFAVDVYGLVSSSVEAIVNQAMAFDDGASGPDLDPTNNLAAESTPIDRSHPGPDLVLVLEGLPGSISPGGNLQAALVLTNVGSHRATGMVIRITVPRGTTWATPATAGWDCSVGAPAGTICEIQMGSLQPFEAELAAGVVLSVGERRPRISALQLTALVYDDGGNGPEENPDDNFASASVRVRPGR